MVQALTLVEMPPTLQAEGGPLQGALITIIKYYRDKDCWLSIAHGHVSGRSITPYLPLAN